MPFFRAERSRSPHRQVAAGKNVAVFAGQLEGEDKPCAVYTFHPLCRLHFQPDFEQAPGLDYGRPELPFQLSVVCCAGQPYVWQPTSCNNSQPATANWQRSTFTVTSPPEGVNFMALEIRLAITCWTCPGPWPITSDSRGVKNRSDRFRPHFSDFQPAHKNGQRREKLKISAGRWKAPY